MTNWQTGDVITAEKLNDLESRASGALIIHLNQEGTAVDKTWQEIYDAFHNGRMPTIIGPDDSSHSINGEVCMPIISVGVIGSPEEPNAYYIDGYDYLLDGGGTTRLYASSPTDYPLFD